jgi:hypothetical protein
VGDQHLKRLTVVALFVGVLMVFAAATAMLAYVLHAGSDIGSDWFLVSVGAIPGLATASVIGVATLDRDNHRRVVVMLRTASAVGLPFIVIGGAASGFGLGFSELRPGSPAAHAAFAYQVAYVAAVAGDLILLVASRLVHLDRGPS